MLDTRALDEMPVACPRCGADVHERFYGPCTACRTSLRELLAREGRAVEDSRYEPKVNVTPNAVALKDD